MLRVVLLVFFCLAHSLVWVQQPCSRPRVGVAMEYIKWDGLIHQLNEKYPDMPPASWKLAIEEEVLAELQSNSPDVSCAMAADGSSTDYRFRCVLSPSAAGGSVIRLQVTNCMGRPVYDRDVPQMIILPRKTHRAEIKPTPSFPQEVIASTENTWTLGLIRPEGGSITYRLTQGFSPEMDAFKITTCGIDRQDTLTIYVPAEGLTLDVIPDDSSLDPGQQTQVRDIQDDHEVCRDGVHRPGDATLSETVQSGYLDGSRLELHNVSVSVDPKTNQYQFRFLLPDDALRWKVNIKNKENRYNACTNREDRLPGNLQSQSMTFPIGFMMSIVARGMGTEAGSVGSKTHTESETQTATPYDRTVTKSWAVREFDAVALRDENVYSLVDMLGP